MSSETITVYNMMYCHDIEKLSFSTNLQIEEGSYITTVSVFLSSCDTKHLMEMHVMYI